jgi:hypothetical protein
MEYLDNGDFVELMLGDYSILHQPVVRPIQNLRELHQVYKLTHDNYVNLGYCDPHPSRMLIHYPTFDHLPETTILVALDHGRIIGSVSVTRDGPSGFTIDQDFPGAISKIREEGKPCASVWRMVVEESMKTRRAVVIRLMSELFHRMIDSQISNVLFAVNPKHVDVYQRMLQMNVVEKKLNSEGLNNAPAVLLRGNPNFLPATSLIDSNPATQSFNLVHFLLSESKY